MSTELLLGVDIGTTATKAAVFALDGTRVAAARHPTAMRRPHAGWAEQDPVNWIVDVQTVVAELGRRADLEAIAAVGVCSQVNTHVFVDVAGRPLRPAITWQDQRCADVAAALDGRLDEAARERIWGAPFTVDASHLAARAAWVAEHEPAIWERTRWILSPKDLINLVLTGEVGSDPVSSIGLVGPGGDYLDGLDELVDGLTRRLPPLGDLASPLGVTSRVGGGRPACVARGTMDAWGNLIGSGAVAPGRAMHVAGTSEVLAVIGAGPGGAPGVVSFTPWRGLHVHAGPTQAGGDALRWLAESLGCSMEEALSLAAQAAPGSGGVIFLPQLLGERAPLWDPDLRAAWIGMSFSTSRPELARAVLEGVAHSARHLLGVLEEAVGAPVTELVLSGGAARDDGWCQTKADILGRPLHRSRELDTGTLGAAVMGGLAAGLIDDVVTAAERMVHIERTFAPNHVEAALHAHGHAVYLAAQQRLSDLPPALIPRTREPVGAPIRGLVAGRPAT